MLVIAIDGACRRNGKQNCVSAGGAFIMHYNNALELTHTSIKVVHEIGSTNQRGEMLALLIALDYVSAAKRSAQLITDSEYLFNTVTKRWYDTWELNDWKTAAGTKVKNKDIWLQIKHAFNKCESEVLLYHIKGHLMPFGKVTARKLLEKDNSGTMLYEAVKNKYKSAKNIYERAAALSEKNNGFVPNKEVMERFVVTNVVADAIATAYINCVDQP